MVVAGYDRDSPRKKIIEDVIVNKILGEAGATASEVFTYKKFASFGLVRFGTKKDKDHFKKWLSTNKLSAGLYACDNKSKGEREMERPMGKVRKAIAAMLKSGDEVEVEYEGAKSRVYCKEKLVAKWGKVGEHGFGNLVLTGEAWSCREHIQTLMKEMGEKDEEL